MRKIYKVSWSVLYGDSFSDDSTWHEKELFFETKADAISTVNSLEKAYSLLGFTRKLNPTVSEVNLHNENI